MIHHGDCLEVMAGLPAESVDAIVTDPPYGLGFMGKEWDALPPGKEWADECLRVLKPGGHLVAFGGSRTYHRLAVAIEDAGFEIRDQLMWLYGSGFPKSLDVSKAIDKAAGAEREVVGRTVTPFKVDAAAGRGRALRGSVNGDFSKQTDGGGYRYTEHTAPATPEAQKWNGWGTALKPAHEPIVLARKPLTGTVAANVQEYGTGALNVDGCRVEADYTAHELRPNAADHRKTQRNEIGATGVDTTAEGARQDLGYHNSAGRWPANLILDPEAGAMLDEQSGESTTKRNENPSEAPGGNTWGGTFQTNRGARGHSDTGGASRFFYTAKASSAERNAGLYCSSDRDGKVCLCERTQTPKEVSPQRDTDAPTEAAGSGSSTTGSGSRRTAPSQTDSRFTTSTETKRTTGSKTSNSSPRQTTSEPTPLTTESGTASGSGSVPSAASGSRRPSNTSTSASRGGCCTDDADLATSQESSRTSRSESAACPDCGGVIGGGLPVRNAHPLSTVKPIDLMRWLVRLVTPPGGTVLDPFTGSGTTGIAAALEGFDFIGIEREAEYLAIAEARIEWWSRHEGDTAEVLARAGLAEKAQKAHAEAGQLGMLGDAA